MGVDAGLLAVAKKSAAYRQIRLRLAGPMPFDVWEEGELTFLGFSLSPAVCPGTGASETAGCVIFAVDRQAGRLLTVREVAFDDVAARRQSEQHRSSKMH